MFSVLGEASISISQQSDVPAFVSDQVGSGSTLGVIYPLLPAVQKAIDDLSLAVASRVLQLAPDLKVPAPRDKWMESALALIKTNQPPLPAGYPAEMNIHNLFRWVDPKYDRVLIGVVPQLDDAGQRDILSVASWMRGASSRPIEVVHGMPPVRQPRRRGKSRSKPEEALWHSLQNDSQLRGLFEQNAEVQTIFQTRLCVDLLWRAGRLIVEIDGYYHHSHQDQFANDRQRDYETGVSGYVALRLTDDEVLSDTQLATQKIRRYVQIRKRLFYV